MRPGGKQRDDLAADRLCCDVVQLICATDRTKVVKATNAADATNQPLACDVVRCCQQLASGTSALLRILVSLVPKNCEAPQACGETAQPIETWAIQLKASDTRPLPTHFLLQAVRSHLAFSQLSAWTTAAGGLVDFKPVFRLTSWAHQAAEFLCGGGAGWHEFPQCPLDAGRTLSVRVLATQCRSAPPQLAACTCASGTGARSPARPIGRQDTDDDRLVMDGSESPIDGPREHHCVDDDTSHNTDDASQPTPVAKRPSPARRIESSDMLCDHASNEPTRPISGLQLPPVEQRRAAIYQENHLFGVISNAGPPPLPDAIRRLAVTAYRAPTDNTGMRTPPRPTQLPVCSPPTPQRRRSPVNFWVGSGESAQSPTGEQPPAHSAAASPSSPTNTGKSGRRRRRSQKILFSCSDVTAAAGLHAGETSFMDVDEEEPAGPSTSTGAHCGASSCASSSTADGCEPAVRPTARRERDSQRNLRQTIFERFRFGPNGLPLTSSPAPLKRNQNSFDFDATLCTVTGLRGTLYGLQHGGQLQQQTAGPSTGEHYDSGSSDSECAVTATSPCCKSAPASSHLLGNFEESALNGRIKPFGSLDGFTLDLAASGAFCPAHVRLPVATVFFNMNDDNAPLPFLGMCNFEALRKKAYHLPKKGTIQATLFNPNGTVVKMFVVRYDVSDMPAHAHTVIRQRTFFLPQSATLADARRNRHWLRYLIHLRLATSRSARLYLHTDIRMLFSRKTELDGVPPAGVDATAGAPAEGAYELRSFTEMPTEPRYSVRPAHTV